MPKVHHIKSARKADPKFGIKVGDSYYKWSLMTGPRSSQTFKSKNYPKPSDLTSSPFKRELYGFQEEIQELTAEQIETVEDLSSFVDDITGRIEALQEEQQENRDNMPEHLQDGSVGQLLEERCEGLGSWVSSLQSIDLSFEFDQEEPVQPEDKNSQEHQEWEEALISWKEQKAEAESEFINNAIEEIQGAEEYSE